MSIVVFLVSFPLVSFSLEPEESQAKQYIIKIKCLYEFISVHFESTCETCALVHAPLFLLRNPLTRWKSQRVC